jgi:hypothetical protein
VACCESVMVSHTTWGDAAMSHVMLPLIMGNGHNGTILYCCCCFYCTRMWERFACQIKTDVDEFMIWPSYMAASSWITSFILPRVNNNAWVIYLKYKESCWQFVYLRKWPLCLIFPNVLLPLLSSLFTLYKHLLLFLLVCRFESHFVLLEYRKKYYFSRFHKQ